MCVHKRRIQTPSVEAQDVRSLKKIFYREVGPVGVRMEVTQLTVQKQFAFLESKQRDTK